MKKIYIIILVLFTFLSLKAAEIKCDTALQKVNPACSKILKSTGSKIGGAFDGMKNFSKKHQTIGQTLNPDKDKKVEKKKTLADIGKDLKKFSEKHKTISDTQKIIQKKK